jgi:hypothetical protein
MSTNRMLVANPLCETHQKRNKTTINSESGTTAHHINEYVKNQCRGLHPERRVRRQGGTDGGVSVMMFAAAASSDPRARWRGVSGRSPVRRAATRRAWCSRGLPRRGRKNAPRPPWPGRGADMGSERSNLCFPAKKKKKKKI